MTTFDEFISVLKWYAENTDSPLLRHQYQTLVTLALMIQAGECVADDVINDAAQRAADRRRSEFQVVVP